MSQEVFVIPASFAQQRLWFLDQLEPGNPAYNIPAALRLEGRLRVDVLARSLEEVVRRHEALRTRFALGADGELTQVIAPSVNVEMPVTDLQHLDAGGRERRVRELADAESRRGFDLADDQLLRVRVLRLGAEEHVLLLTLHHIIADAWSMSVLVREVAALYEAFAKGEPSPLAELPVQYADFAVWQREWLTGPVLEQHLDYWRRRLAGAPPLLALPTSKAPPATKSFRGARLPFALSAGLSESLRRLSRAEGVTLFMTLLAAFDVLLSRHTGSRDIVVGTPVAGRLREETKDLIGLFVNTLALRTDLSGDPTFAELLARVRETCLGAYAHQEAPFERVVEELRPDRNLGHTPLFQVMLSLNNAPREEFQLPGLRMSRIEVESGAAKYDLSLLLEERGGQICGTFFYNSDLFDEPAARDMARQFEALLESVVSDPRRPVKELRLLSPEEERRLLSEWGGASRQYPAAASVLSLFEAQAARTPDAVALVFEDERLTYAELNARASRLGRYLRRVGVGPETRVGLCVERGAEMIVGLLGTLKAGGAYVPLDPDSPAERLAFLLEDAGVSVVLTQRRLLPRLPPAARAFSLDGDGEPWAGESAENLPDAPAPENLVYVIYTSGSTGRPKGVAVEHRQLLNYVRAVSERLGLAAGESFATVSTLAADLGNTAIYPALCTGGELHVIARETASDPDVLAAYFGRHAVDCLKIVPTHLSALLAGANPAGVLPRRRLVLGGEASSWKLCERLQSLAPGCEIFNHYGPTETTVGVMTYRVEGDASARPEERLPLGRPLANTRVYLLDEHLNPVPPGVAGEVCVGGEAPARGYLNRPALTAERFVPDPLSAVPGARLYKTGDRARYLSGGDIEFLGRLDLQVKVRGYRVELGEVEAVIRRHPRLSAAVALAWEERQGENTLVAYVVPEPGGAPPAEGELRSFVGQRLPDYMVPSLFVTLDALPLTPNGKVDRRQLPAPQRGERERGAGFAAPRDPAEELLAGVWSQVLGLERVGVHDNFFDLGGHSLLATRVVSRLRETFGVELPLRQLFEAPTVAGLARRVEEARRGGETAEPAAPLKPAARGASLPLSYAQQRLWFLDQLQPGSPFYNLPGAVRLRGALDVRALEAALNEVVRRHEVLRTTFHAAAGEPFQVVAPSLSLPLPVADLSGMAEDARAAETRRLIAEESRKPFDLGRAPLIRAQLLRLGESEHVLSLTMHHIVSDGWSIGVLVRELTALYGAYAGGLAPSLSEIGIQYADYAQWQRQQMAGGALERGLAYWRRQLEGAPKLFSLPADRPRPLAQTHRGATLPFSLPADLTARLKELSRAEGVTLFMTLLAAFKLLLARHTGERDIVVGTPVAGRMHEETEGLVGFFVNMLVLRTDLSGSPTWRELLGRVRETCLGAYSHQEVPFERVVEELRPDRGLGHTPLFQVMFAFDNTPQEPLRLPGLEVERERLEGETAKYDLTLSLEEGEQGLTGLLEYSAELYEEATVRRLLGHYGRALEALAAGAGERALRAELLKDEERELLLRGWNETAADYEAGLCVHELFERQARLTPEAVAVVSGAERVSYAELDARAEAVARRLESLGVGAESRVGVLTGRGVGMVAALLGVLKAGGAYVPLDPEYPAERLALMTEDAACGVVLTERHYAAAFETGGATAVYIDELAAVERGGAAAGRAEAVPENLAYVIYTSGSTGRPKGVMVSHRNVVNFMAAMDEKFGGAGPGVWLAVTSISFDISVLELFWALTRGFKVVIPEHLGLRPSAAADGLAEKAMDFSLFYFASDDNAGGSDIYELLLEGAKFADAHGFSAVWTPERHFHSFGGLYPNPAVTSAAIAAVTKRVQIRAGSVVIPLHDPLRVAEEWSVVDNLSKGRVAISFASGWHANDFVLAPDIYQERHEWMYRNIDAVRKLWRGEPLVRRGGAGADIEVRIHPRPVQPELPFWITAAGNPETFRTAGLIGANLLTHLLGQTTDELEEKVKVYRAAWREGGHAGEGRVTLMLHTFVGDDLERVRELVREPFSNYLRSSISLLRHSARALGRDLDSKEITEDDMRAVLAHAFDRYFETSALLGTTESCLRMIDQLKAIGVDEVGCLIDFGVGHETVLANLPRLDELRRRSNPAGGAGGQDRSLSAEIRRHGVTHLQCTPSMARMLMAEPETVGAMRQLRYLLVGGEALPEALARQLREALPCEIHNMYGPTETTIWSLTDRLGEAGSAVTIGRPIANTSVYLLDEFGAPVPVGLPGELLIGGEGVARGYLNRPALTAERFVPDPFSREPGARLYKTGDLARYLPDGRVEFLGRDDHQVKVRGHRVEVGEVEAALRQCPGVAEAVVVAREDSSGERRLLAYVVAGPGAGLSAAAAREFLQRKLPAYMIPSAVTLLPEVPLTPNGKVDRRALPEPTWFAPESEAAYVEPATEIEQTIAAIWREVLKVERVGVEDNFFEAGGTSMLVVQVNSKLREAFDRSIPLFEMFRHPTVGALARLIEGGKGETPSFEGAQARAGKQAEALSRQRRLAQQARRPPRKTR